MNQSEQEAEQLIPREIDIGETELIFTLSETDLLFDVKALMKEYYCGTFTESGKGLKLQFTNGQKFILSIKEITKE